MATFFSNLFNSIFTPGPTSTLITATNATFAALQLLLLTLLIATYSIHFIVLSILSAGLWWAINWFVTELQATSAQEKEAKHLRDSRRGQDEKFIEDSGTETEPAETESITTPIVRTAKDTYPNEDYLQPDNADASMRKRRSLGEASGDLSTDSEWDKVDEEEDVEKSSVT